MNRSLVHHQVSKATSFGLSLIEVILTIAIMAMLSLGIYRFAISLVAASESTRSALMATELIEQQVEIVRNLPYASVGIVNGVPSGVLEHTKTVNQAGMMFTVVTTVRNVDDPFDGVAGGSPNDTAAADYKLVEISVTCTNCRSQTTYTMTTTQAPKALENASTNGNLFIQALDAAGDPVADANVHVVNELANPDIVVDDVTDSEGWLRIIDAPPGTNAYAVTVSRAGYSTDRTYAVGDPVGNVNPEKRHATVASQQVTQISLAIDQNSTLNVTSVYDNCSPVADIPFTLAGAKTVGSDDALPPNIFYKYNQSLVTDGAGVRSLIGMEWDTYLLDMTSSLYDLRGVMPLSPFVLAPAATQTVNVVLAEKAPHSLLVTVKDSSGAPISGAAVTVMHGGLTQVQTTDVDFNAGTTADTDVVGTGTAGAVQLASTPNWLAVSNRGSSIIHTTDTDWNAGTMVATAVTGSGSLGSVVTSVADNWAAKTAPHPTGLYNDTYLYSTTFGFAVGNGGIIAKWDGTSWASLATPTTDDLYGTAIISATEAWAVGESGRIIRWNGAVWSSFGVFGTRTFRDIRMTSISAGWAVADGGVIYRWNGTTWTAESSPTAENLTGVAGSTPPAAVPGSLSETTDTDFTSGTLTGTAVTGSGAAGAVTLGQALSWAAPSSPTSTQLNDVFLYSASLGFAVGDDGTVIKWNGSSWSDDPTFPDTSDVMGVAMVSATEAWAVGSSGRFWRWNGSTWTRHTDTGSEIWNDVACPAANTCFAVTDDGIIYRWNGSNWSASADLGYQTLYGVACTSTSYCRAVGTSGNIFTWNGTTWSQPIDTGSQTWNDVAMLDANNGWAVGDGGAIRRCVSASSNCDSSGEWVSSSSGTYDDLKAVTAVSASFAIAVGEDGTILKWNGSSWSSESSPTNNWLDGVFALSTSEVVGVGATGDIVEYAAHYQTSGTYASDTQDAGTAVTWTTLSWTETLPSGTDLTVAVRTSSDGSAWSGWSAEYTAAGGVTLAVPRRRYLQYRATLTTSNIAVTSSLNSLSISYDSSAPSLFATSSAGTIIGRNGTAWAQVGYLAGLAFSGLACDSPNDCWATADSGRLARWDGTVWSQFVDLGGQTFTDINLVSSSLGWITGGGGEIYRWNGSNWTAETSTTANQLNSVFGLSSSFAVAVGASGTLLEFGTHHATSGTLISAALDSGTAGMVWNTAVWTATLPTGTSVTVATRASDVNPPSGSFTNVTAIGGDGQSGSLASGGGTGRYLQYRLTLTGTATTTAAVEDITVTYNAASTSQINGIAMLSDTDGWAVGAGGAIRRWNGSSWSSFTSPTTNTLFGVKMTSSTNGWAVGTGGKIIRWNGTSWSAVTSNTTSTLYAADFTSATDGWAVGAGGTIMRWNGTAWSAATSGTSVDLNAISMIATGNAWAVGEANTMVRLSSSTWTASAGPFTVVDDLYGVHMITTTNAQVVGKNGIIAAWNGASWSAVTSPTASSLYAADFASATDGWAVGAGGTVLRWNGASWTDVTPVTTKNLRAIHVLATDDIWAGGANDTFLHYTPLFATSGTFISSAIDAGSSQPWYTLSWTPIVPAATSVTMATRTGNSLPLSGAWSAGLEVPSGSTIPSPNGRYFQYRLTATTTDLTVSPQVTSVSVYYGTLNALVPQDTGNSLGGQTDWSGGPGQVTYDGTAMFYDSDGNIEYGSTGQLTLKATAGVYAASGELTSATFDVGDGNTYGLLHWLATQPAQAGANSLKVQVAANNDNTTWNFVGPDGTTATYYTTTGAAITAAISGNRYFRYRVYLTTADTAYTPTVTDLNFSYTPACAPAGQALLQNLMTGSYNITVTKTGYDDYAANAYGISADWAELVIALTNS